MPRFSSHAYCILLCVCVSYWLTAKGASYLSALPLSEENVAGRPPTSRKIILKDQLTPENADHLFTLELKIDKENKQAGAELCQAKFKFG